jgi:GT2 family glycosyltransferase
MASSVSPHIPKEVGILIPTRNRPEMVQKLLKSLQNSTLKPAQIVIVSSGTDISYIVDEFQSVLEITYLHTEVAGQVNQKKIGTKLLCEDLKWVIFLDDDLVVGHSCIEAAIQGAESVERQLRMPVLGVGLALPSTSRVSGSNRITKLIGKCFGISNSDPGVVRKNGHAVSYLESEKVICTQWLNGASMWKREIVNDYGLNLTSSKYAACEDLFFSYPQRLLGKLVFVPTAKAEFQNEELTDFENFSVFKSAALWRLNFVISNEGFSRLLFLYSQIGRTLFGILRTKESRFRFTVNSIALFVQLICIGTNKGKLENLIRTV